MIAIAIALALAAPAAVVATPEQEALLESFTARMDDWKLCVHDTAGSWALQQGTPSEVVDAVFGKCAPALAVMEAQLAKISDYDASRPMVNDLTSYWRSQALAIVYERRGGSK